MSSFEFVEKVMCIGGGDIFNFTADSSPVYIKTNGKCSLSIL